LEDAAGEEVLRIRENVITFDKNNVFRLELHPNRVVVVNWDGKLASASDATERSVWEFNGDFYHGRWHIVATPEGTLINSVSPAV
jgi:hypothetical protein